MYNALKTQNDAVYLKRSQAYELLGRYDLALDDVSACLQVNNMCLEAHISKSKLHLKLRDVNNSITACNIGLELYASNQELQDVLCQAVSVSHNIIYVHSYSMRVMYDKSILMLHQSIGVILSTCSAILYTVILHDSVN